MIHVLVAVTDFPVDFSACRFEVDHTSYWLTPTQTTSSQALLWSGHVGRRAISPAQYSVMVVSTLLLSHVPSYHLY